MQVLVKASNLNAPFDAGHECTKRIVTCSHRDQVTRLPRPLSQDTGNWSRTPPNKKGQHKLPFSLDLGLDDMQVKLAHDQNPKAGGGKGGAYGAPSGYDQGYSGGMCLGRRCTPQTPATPTSSEPGVVIERLLSSGFPKVNTGYGDEWAGHSAYGADPYASYGPAAPAYGGYGACGGGGGGKGHGNRLSHLL
eukprot:3594641-Amphidinium_carterae.3